MKENVIETAGKAWRYLKENGETSTNVLTRRLKERSDVVNQSIGWLAREDKVNFIKKGNKEFVSLTE